MAKKGRSMRWWLLARSWWANRGAHAIVILLVLVSFPLYGIYSAWSGAVRTPVGEEVIRVAPPADVLWALPYWLSAWGGEEYRLDKVLEREDIRENLLDHHMVLKGPVLSPWGSVDAWGVSSGWNSRPLGIQVSAAGPRSGGVLLDQDLPGGAQVGESTRVSHVDPMTREVRSLEVTVEGFFTSDSPLVSGLILERGDMEYLLGSSTPNAALLWAVPRAPRIIGPAYRPTAIERQPLFLVRQIQGLKPFDLTRHPPVRLEPSSQAAGGLGATLPFAGVQGGFLFWDPEFPAQRLASLYTIVEGVAGLVGLAFLLLALGLTVIILVTVMDQEQELGAYKALGFTPEEISGLYALQMSANLLVGTLLGIPLLAYLVPVASGVLGLPLAVPGAAYAIWTLAMAVLVVWSGRVVAVMFESPSVMSLLRQESRFDWWGLIRL